MIHLQYAGIGLLVLLALLTILVVSSWLTLSAISLVRSGEVEKFKEHFVDHLLLGSVMYTIMVFVYIMGRFIATLLHNYTL
jgi:hypothetical protein